MTALDKLIEVVEGGGFPRDLDELNRSKVFKDWNQGYTAGRAFNGSLDAAKALHEALLPDYLWAVTPLGKVRILDKSLNDIEESGYSGSVARAWLLSILKAYRGKNTDS